MSGRFAEAFTAELAAFAADVDPATRAEANDVAAHLAVDMALDPELARVVLTEALTVALSLLVTAAESGSETPGDLWCRLALRMAVED